MDEHFAHVGPGLVQRGAEWAASPVLQLAVAELARQGVHEMAHRFIAGATPRQALPQLRRLADRGVATSLDLLGEATLSEAEADAYQVRYQELLTTLTKAAGSLAPRGAQWTGVPPINISIKCSALSAHFEPAAPEFVSRAVTARLRPLLRRARQSGAYLHFDLEQYRDKDLIHRIFADLALDPEFADYPHLGIVVQAYLRDAPDDLARLRELAERRGAPITIRLVKGA